ncbi:hypothetical protein ACROYT_G015600 [Oculina patagonica]
MLMEAITIPDDWIAMAYARLSELTAIELNESNASTLDPMMEVEALISGNKVSEFPGIMQVYEVLPELSDSFVADELQAIEAIPNEIPLDLNNQSPSPFTTRNVRMHRTRCDKRFSDKSVLNRHLKAHDKRIAERSFTCNTCGETFHNRAPFNSHIQTAHQTLQPTSANRKRPTAEKSKDSPPAKKAKKTSESISNHPATSRSTPQASDWKADPVVMPSNLASEISSKSLFLLRQKYAAVFEALHQASFPNHGETANNHETQEENFESKEEEARGIDLMASDNEEDEEVIESEIEEDCAFVDDEIEEQEDMSFYRRLNVGLDNDRKTN